MPREDRRIVFELDEIYKALYALSTQKQAKKMPPGHIVSIKVDDKDDKIIYFSIENPQDRSKAQLDFTRDFVAAALMLFCRGLGIPLPKSAQKSVEVGATDITLRVLVQR